MKVKIPRRVTVGAYEYELRMVDTLLRDDRLLGRCNSDTGIIEIEPSANTNIRAVTLFHEIIEAINLCYSCKMEHDDIDRMAHGLAATLQRDLGIEFDWEDIE